MLDAFARLLGIKRDDADDALRSESVARHVLTRRSFFGAAGAMATGAAFSFGAAQEVVLDYVFLEGMYPGRIVGKEGWAPIVGDSPMFFGVDRSEDPQTLKGLRVGESPLVYKNTHPFPMHLKSIDHHRGVLTFSS